MHEKARALHDKISQNETARRVLLSENAAYLSELEENKLYTSILGDETAPWSAYLGQVETFYSRSQANSLIRVYRVMKRLEIPLTNYYDIPLSRLVDILPILTKENAEDWFGRARLFVSKDWKVETRKEKGLITEEDEHEHEMKVFEQCEKCGFKIPHTHER